MVVKALGVAGASLTERQMTINIVQVHADAFNFADLTVLVTLEPGEGVYGNREEARGQLAEHVLYWLATAQASYPHAMKDMAELDVLLRFAQTAGVCYHIPSATEKSRWG